MTCHILMCTLPDVSPSGSPSVAVKYMTSLERCYLERTEIHTCELHIQDPTSIWRPSLIGRDQNICQAERLLKIIFTDTRTQSSFLPTRPLGVPQRYWTWFNNTTESCIRCFRHLLDRLWPAGGPGGLVAAEPSEGQVIDVKYFTHGRE